MGFYAVSRYEKGQQCCKGGWGQGMSYRELKSREQRKYWLLKLEKREGESRTDSKVHIGSERVSVQRRELWRFGTQSQEGNEVALSGCGSSYFWELLRRENSFRCATLEGPWKPKGSGMWCDFSEFLDFRLFLLKYGKLWKLVADKHGAKLSAKSICWEGYIHMDCLEEKGKEQALPTSFWDLCCCQVAACQKPHHSPASCVEDGREARA